MELNDRTDVDVYFPDGTFCHSEGETDYFCRKHRCLSSARGGRYEVVPDLDVNGNARPDGKLSVPSDAEAYFSLDSNVSVTLLCIFNSHERNDIVGKTKE